MRKIIKILCIKMWLRNTQRNIQSFQDALEYERLSAASTKEEKKNLSKRFYKCIESVQDLKRYLRIDWDNGERIYLKLDKEILEMEKSLNYKLLDMGNKSKAGQVAVLNKSYEEEKEKLKKYLDMAIEVYKVGEIIFSIHAGPNREFKNPESEHLKTHRELDSYTI